MKSARPDESRTGAAGQAAPIVVRFPGSDKPRHRRVLLALLRGPLLREELDRVAGASNGPALVQDLRNMGLSVDCEHIERRDRDGRLCRPGRYSLTESARAKVLEWRAALRSDGEA